MPPALLAGTGGPVWPQQGRDIPRLGGFRKRRTVRTLLIGNRGPLSEGLVCLGSAVVGSEEAVIEVRVGEITGNIWLAFYLHFLIKWPLLCREWGGWRGRQPCGDTQLHPWMRDLKVQRVQNGLPPSKGVRGTGEPHAVPLHASAGTFLLKVVCSWGISATQSPHLGQQLGAGPAMG